MLGLTESNRNGDAEPRGGSAGRLATRLARQPVAWFLTGVFGLLYLLLFVPPLTPFYLPGDSTIYLMNAVRMLEGQALYKDFFQFTFPGTEVFFLGLFKLFGPRLWIPNATLLLLGLGLAWVILYISRRVMTGSAPFLSSLLFLVCVYWSWLDATHHWFSTLLVMAAVAFVIEERNPRRLAGAGAICGLASFFTQIKGVMALLGLAAFVLWEQRQKGASWHSTVRRAMCLFAAFIGALAALSAYFVEKAGLRGFLYCTIEFGIKYYPSESSNNLWVYMTTLPDLVSRSYTAIPKVGIFVLIHGLLPLVFIVFSMRYRRMRTQLSAPWNSLMLVNAVGLALFISVAPAPAATRLYAVSPPALILFVWLLNSTGRPRKALLGCLWASVFLMATAECWLRQTHWRLYLDLSTGRCACFYRTTCGEYEWMLRRTRPGDYFLEGGWSDYYYLLSLRNPTTVPFLTTTGYLRPEQVHEAIEGLERHSVRYVLWSPTLDIQDPRGRGEDHLGPLRHYLSAHYGVAKTFTDGSQVWERK
jgi:hypothetical protein